MTKAQKAFFEQIELEEEDVKRDFLISYAYGLLDENEDEPVQRAIEMLNAEWELDPKATSAIVQLWIDDKEAVSLAKLGIEAENRKGIAIQKFREQREAGATYTESVKATGEDPGYMTQVLKEANMFELSPERLRILRQARHEEYRSKAFRARQKAYRLISSKVEKAMKNADFSSVSPDKLADIMLKLSQITKEDEPPIMSIEFDWNKKI